MKKGNSSILLTVLGATIGAVSAGAAVSNKSEKKIKKYKELADKHFAIMKLYDQWLLTKQEGKSLAEYLTKEGIHSIAIYGMSFVGERLYDELVDSDIEIKYGIDKNADHIYSEIDMINPEGEYGTVDAIIVTAVFYFDEIASMLEEKTDIKVLSLEDILNDM